jgi:hypothetical protein
VVLTEASDRREIAALADAFVTSPLLARLARCRDVRREETFAFALPDGELLWGFVDVSGVEASGTRLIVDYKTDHLAPGEDLIAHVERDYSLQRLVYALAGLQAGAPAVEIAYAFLRAPQHPVSIVYAAEDRERLEAQLRERIAILRSARFEVTPAPGRERCATCPGRARLCSYDESLTLRPAAA